MTPTQTTIVLIYGAIIAAWPIRYLVLKYILGKTQFLSPGSPTLDAADPPLVSAVIPAKDEEATLADCLASVCLQAYPRLEILVIDDRSVDRTRQIANEFADRDARLRVLSNDHLPPGLAANGSGSSTLTRCMPLSSLA
jgi:cellulose synthase/poly-beta-1,6-N-acetylglucosamine synthase-like glycosyltransferase